MKKIFAAAALLLAMTACGGSQKEALPLEGTTWKLAKMEAIPAKAVDAEADFFTLQFRAADTLVKMLDEVDGYEIKGEELKFYDDKKLLAEFRAVQDAAAQKK